MKLILILAVALTPICVSNASLLSNEQQHILDMASADTVSYATKVKINELEATIAELQATNAVLLRENSELKLKLSRIAEPTKH